MSSDQPVCPHELDGATVERFASVSGLPRKLTVLMDGREIEAPSAIAICRYLGEESAYFFHCSATWAVLAASHHPSSEAAVASAERGYPGVSARWESHA